jgi:cytochrome c-type biogenesis protein CcmF
VLFLAAAFAVLWGTIYPIVAEVTNGVRLSVGPPFFNRVFVPLGLALLGLAGIGPLISWRRMSSGSFGRLIRPPLAAGAAAAVLLVAFGLRSAGAILALALCMFTAVAIGSEFVRGGRVYRKREQLSWAAAVARTLSRNRRRYGGYVVHLGIVLIVIGFAGTAFKVERQALLSPGESMSVGSYVLRYEGARQASTTEKQMVAAEVTVMRDGENIGTLHPQRNFHVAQRQFQSEVAIRTNPVEDLYLVVTGFDADGDAALRAFVNPLTWWIWAGAAVMAIGIGVIMTGRGPHAAPEQVRTKVREPAVATR